MQNANTGDYINANNVCTLITDETICGNKVFRPFRSCRPAWLEMDRKFCPNATTSSLPFGFYFYV